MNHTATNWNARFAWFWYNDREIFHDSQEEIDAKVKVYVDAGITHLITFSCTHFRWSFEPHWAKIHQCLARIVRAAHKYGLKVVEHHSSHLESYPDTPGKMEYLRKLLEQRKSKMESWPGLVEFLLDPNNPHHKWVQVDAGTGLPPVAYNGHAKCFNNPEYRTGYLKYLEQVYACGVDGIMTDDVQYFCLCGCEHCRRLFTEKYAQELPQADKFGAWADNMLDPAFVEFLRFRFDAVNAFHVLVKEHYEKLGLKLLRPNYASDGLNNDRYAGGVESVPALDWFFQECMFSSIIRYSWNRYLYEQQHRAMVARQRNIPHMMMFYADRPDSLVFAWAVSRLAGAMFTNTPEGSNDIDESQIRRFEKLHAGELFGAEPVTSVGFIDSQANRRFGAGYGISRFRFWMQTCIFNNIPFRLLDINRPADWGACSVLCANEIHLLASGEIEKLRQFASDGGILLISETTGDQDEHARLRTKEEMEKLWGVRLASSDPDSIVVHKCGRGAIGVTGWAFGYPDTKENCRKYFSGRCPERFKYNSEALFDDMQYNGFGQGRGAIAVPPVKVRENRYEAGAAARRLLAAKLNELVGDRSNFKAELPELVIAAPFVSCSGKTMSIQLLNAAGTCAVPASGLVSHADPIPFLPWDGPDGIFSIKLPAGLAGMQTAEFIDLAGNTRRLPVRKDSGMMRITLPAGMLKDYAMIRIS